MKPGAAPRYRWTRAGITYVLMLAALGVPERAVARVYRLDGGGWRAVWAFSDDEGISEAHTLYEVQRAAELAVLPEGAQRTAR